MKAKTAVTDQTTNTWIDEQEVVIEQGRDIIKEASDEALEYVVEAIQNMNDKQWRKMVISTQAVEMGIGIGMAEHLVPVIYKDMEKSLHKKISVTKNTSEALRHIYIGRVIKNISKALNERN